MGNDQYVEPGTQGAAAETQEVKQEVVETGIESNTSESNEPVKFEAESTLTDVYTTEAEPIKGEDVTSNTLVDTDTAESVSETEGPAVMASAFGAPAVSEETQTTEPALTADEEIISKWLSNGKNEATTNDLIEAGFDNEKIDSYSFSIGRYKLSRILMVSPYKIELTA